MRLYNRDYDTRFCSKSQGEISRPEKILRTEQKTAPDGWVYVRQYCAEIDEAARNRMELIVPELVKRNGVTEQLKAENQMEWVRQMNACKAQAEEVVKFELIYD
ncbi:MAG: TnpV protein [Oscillospiraceae bacterium]